MTVNVQLGGLQRDCCDHLLAVRHKAGLNGDFANALLHSQPVSNLETGVGACAAWLVEVLLGLGLLLTACEAAWDFRRCSSCTMVNGTVCQATGGCLQWGACQSLIRLCCPDPGYDVRAIWECPAHPNL